VEEDVYYPCCEHCPDDCPDYDEAHRYGCSHGCNEFWQPDDDDEPGGA